MVANADFLGAAKIVGERFVDTHTAYAIRPFRTMEDKVATWLRNDVNGNAIAQEILGDLSDIACYLVDEDLAWQIVSRIPGVASDTPYDPLRRAIFRGFWGKSHRRHYTELLYELGQINKRTKLEALDERIRQALGDRLDEWDKRADKIKLGNDQAATHAVLA